jgi:uroporphyrinogen-III decarboxylase
VEGGSRYTTQTLTVGGRTLTAGSRRDPAVATTWATDYLLQDVADVKAYLQLPDAFFDYTYSVDHMLAEERELGDAGIVMVNVADPICAVAPLFSLADYTVFALTEPHLFHQLLEMHARYLHPMAEEVAKQFPGRLWRVVGSEYASEPFLPPRLYDEYVVRYTKPMVDSIRRYGGYARVHSHGRLKNILPYIAAMGVDGLDPVEPPPQGDMALIDVRRAYGEQMVLFGNIEASELETLSPPAFEARVKQALYEGTAGEGRGFVLMPSACPYGRVLPPDVLENYRTMVRLAKEWRGAV